MLHIMSLPDRERFLNIVQHSRGEVLLRLPDGTDCDLKEDTGACQLLCSLELGPEGVSITLTDPKDLPRYLQYMMEARQDPTLMRGKKHGKQASRAYSLNIPSAFQRPHQCGVIGKFQMAAHGDAVGQPGDPHVEGL